MGRESEYKQYLETHINNVKRVWEELLKPHITNNRLKLMVSEVVENHDKSKYGEEEWKPYLDYFYPDPVIPSDVVDKNFNYAWLHHIHNNPHHWQYWLLQEDEGNLLALDMPEVEVLHMLCDWGSFRYNDDSMHSTREWYENNKKHMKLSENTQKLIEKYIDFLDLH